MDTLHKTKKIAQIRALQCHFCERAGIKKPAHCKMCRTMDREIDELVGNSEQLKSRLKEILKDLEKLLDFYEGACHPMSDTIKEQREQKGF